jgi:hypothetical protein
MSSSSTARAGGSKAGMEGGREDFEERDLVGVLVAFGVPEAEAGAIAADMRAGAEPLVGADESGGRTGSGSSDP